MMKKKPKEATAAHVQNATSMEIGQPSRFEPGIGQTYSVWSSSATSITNLSLLKKERAGRYHTGLQFSEAKLQWITTIQDKRQMLGDDTVELACSTMQELTESIDEALDQWQASLLQMRASMQVNQCSRESQFRFQNPLSSIRIN